MQRGMEDKYSYLLIKRLKDKKWYKKTEDF